MIDFQFIKTKKLDVLQTDIWIKKIITKEKKELGEIVFVFCSDDYLLQKNIQFLKHDTLTDVITFDYCCDMKISGDILISIDRVKENAKKYNSDFYTELNRVMAHGLLHLLGYSDKTLEENKIMREKEDFYLRQR